MNALKHGLAAKTVPLPNEDPEAIAARAAAWADYYQPDSPAAHHLVNQCVRATLLADRCQEVHDSAVADQVDAAAGRWDQDRQKQVKALRAQLASDPAAAVAGLERTGHGCRWLIGCWEQLDEALEAGGGWTPAQGDHAVRLLGGLPDPESLRRDSWAYLAFLFHLRLQPGPPEDLIAILLQPENRPDDLRDCAPGELDPPPPFCRDWLRDRVRERLDRLRAHEEWLRTEVDDPARSRVLKRFMVLEDEAAARRFFRYHAESRSTFHRAFKELVATLKRDAESPAIDAASASSPSPNEPGTEAPAPPPSPNEPANDPDPAPAPNGPDADRPAPPGPPNEPGTAAARPEETATEATGSGDDPAPADGPAGGRPGLGNTDLPASYRAETRPLAPSPNEPGTTAAARPEEPPVDGPIETHGADPIREAERRRGPGALTGVSLVGASGHHPEDLRGGIEAFDHSLV